jgi:cardiolipin synthase C
MGIGPVVHEVSSQFDQYWSSTFACPVERLVRRATAAEFAESEERLSHAADESAAADYLQAIQALPFARDLKDHTLPLEWATVHTISDDPAKVAGRAAARSLLIEKIRRIFGESATRIDVVSPYFVPGKIGTDMFRRLSSRGVKIRILTNALEATDVAAVHAGYAKRRDALLSAGVKLYELRRTSRIPRSASGPFGSSSSSLHAKTFAVDASRVFVGSFNFDPRSARLNTEMGFVIDSPTLAEQVGRAFDTTIPLNAYEVHKTPGGAIYWTNGDLRYDTEPGTSPWRRAEVWITSRLPVEWLL